MPIPTQPLADTRCTHLDAGGRRCRQLVCTAHSSLCVQHAEAAKQEAEAARLATALTASTPNLKNADDINRVLAQLFSAVSTKKVDLRQGALLAYIAQLMIQTTKSHEPSPVPPPTASTP